MSATASANSSARVGFVSLGCPKALVDSERILTQLRLEGYDTSATYEDADVVVVNTCGFIERAVDESLEAIGEALRENGRVIVTGCLGARASLIRERHPDVLAVTGPQAYEAVVQAVHDAAPPPARDPRFDLVPETGIKLTPRHYAYLKISEGCNHKCTFCVIPSLRGPLVSRPIGDVLTEAERLARAGVKELLVISQDTSAYGLDLRYRTDFWGGRPMKTRLIELCRHLGELVPWVRLHYVYPYPHVDDVIPLMAQGKLLPYLDVPLQHAVPRILRAMRRPAAAERTLERIRRWRDVCPDLTIRSTVIVGFPGETEQDLEALLDFLGEAGIDRLGVFPYSNVDGAAANALPDQVPEAEKHERLARVMAHQADISAARLRRWLGRTVPVLVDRVDDMGVVARSSADAPEIDGVVYVDGPRSERLAPGDLVPVRITATALHDLHAEPA